MTLRRARCSTLLLLLALSSLTPSRARAAPSEFTAVPVVGGDSDVGFGGGYMLSYARTPKGYEPYLWRLESAGAITFKPAQQGANVEGTGLQVPYVDDYLLLQLPHVRRDKLEFELRLSYTREATLKFYGLGNASSLAPNLAPSDRYYEHARVHPTLRWLSTFHLSEAFQLLWGLSYTHNQLDVPADTLLGIAMQHGDAFERHLLGVARDHGVAAISGGFAYDTRDDQVATERGLYVMARTDLMPGGTPGLPYEWARVTAAAQAYLPLVPKRLLFAGRVATDLLAGDPPFYELPRFDDSYFGGGKGVRGVPAQRYWGKIKTLSNLELRSNLFSLHFWDKQNWFGLTAFFDTGRIWSDYHAHPELDGSGLGLKYGAGGGIRVTAGSSFVLRADIAYSPDAHPISGYLTAGQMF